MTSAELENLVAIGRLKREPPVEAELAGLKRSGESRLADAERADLSFENPCFLPAKDEPTAE